MTEHNLNCLIRAIHVVPYDGIGGVETAVRSLPAGCNDGIEFRKCFIADKCGRTENSPYEHHGPLRSENSIVNYVAAIRYVRAHRPDVVICSLWRSCLVLIALRLMWSPTKLVVFVHLPKSVHAVDYVCNRISMALAREIWVDSQTTLELRIPLRLRSRSRVISFLTRRIAAVPVHSPQPNFIFWGRLDPQKGLLRALRIFARVHELIPAARFSVIGPDSAYGNRLQNACRTLAIEDAVHFLGYKGWEEIQREASWHSFYLQTSVIEGMGMSVVEAMQSGLVPVVTPVGEIERFCRDGQNAIVVRDDRRAVQEICDVVASPMRYEQLARAAQAYWQGQTTYRESVLLACRKLAEASS